jgi:hypothetical protein
MRPPRIALTLAAVAGGAALSLIAPQAPGVPAVRADERVYTLQVRGGERTIRVPEGASIEIPTDIVEFVTPPPLPASLRLPNGWYFQNRIVLTLADGSGTGIRFDGTPGSNDARFGWLRDALR